MSDHDIKILVTIITQQLPHAKIYVFGSRARGDFRPESDIDIALDNGKKIDPPIVSQIKEAIEESTIPFTVDLVDLQALSENFKRQILKNGKLCH